MNNIFVGNLSFKATKEDVIKLFESFGSVANVVIMERKKGKSRGYGFVDMPNEEQKNTAIAALEGKEFMERVLSVSPVIPKVKSEVKPKKFKPVQKEWDSSDRAARLQNSSGDSTKSYGRDSKFYRGSKPYRKDDWDSSSKSYPKDNRASGSWSNIEARKKPYKDKESKDRDSKPWTKSQGASKPYRKDPRASESRGNNEGVKKSYNDRESKPWNKSSTPSKGFKMFYKVSRASKPLPKKGQARD